ncbi:MAG: ammonia-forming cytochrome c nitrite reductase subunit c552 [Bacillota bacterium]
MRKSLLFIMIAMVITTVLLLTNCAKKDVPEPQPVPEETGDQIPSPDKMILSAESWKEKYPMIYESFIRTSRARDDVAEDSDLGGQHAIDYLKKYPNIKILYEGMGFSKEYYQARGHYYALEDVINTARPKSGASCLACKTAEYEKLFVQNGSDLFAMDFQKTVQDLEYSISCYNCHRNQPGEGVQITAPHLAEGVKKLASQPAAGTLACVQCHVEYFIDPQTKAVVLPWDNGTGIEQIEAFYDEKNFADWVHPRTGTPLIKVQHPEFEMFTGSFHQVSKVTCAHCHMPTVEENGQEYKSHWAKSPLKTAEESCGRCHGEEVDRVTAVVESVQKDIESREAEVSNMLVKLVEDFAAAIETKTLDDQTIEQIRALHRKAQYRWDFVFVENSNGFHNETKARKALDEAKDYAQQALNILNPQ